MSIYNPRGFLNRLGITFDPTKLRTFFKEDMDEVKSAFDIFDYCQQHHFALTLNTPYSAPPTSGWTRIPLDTVISDPLSGFDPVNHTWVVPHDTIMRISAHALINPINPGARFAIGCFVNGGIVNQFNSNIPTAFFQSADYTFLIPLTAGDIVDFQVNNPNPFNIFVTSGQALTGFFGDTVQYL